MTLGASAGTFERKWLLMDAVDMVVMVYCGVKLGIQRIAIQCILSMEDEGK